MRQAFQAELERFALQVEVMGVRVDENLERIGDLALRVVKRADEFEQVASHEVIADLLLNMSDHVVAQFRTALRAWPSQDVELVADLASVTGEVDHYATRLAQDLDRIADHAAIIGARLRYLLSGDSDHLAAEVR